MYSRIENDWEDGEKVRNCIRIYNTWCMFDDDGTRERYLVIIYVPFCCFRRCQSLFVSASKSVLNGFQSLEGSARELYISFVLKLFTSYGYFALSQILVIYLHNEFGATDIEAGAIYGSWGLCITIWGLLTAYINDRLGVRRFIVYCILKTQYIYRMLLINQMTFRSLLIGFGISALASVVLAFARSKETVYWTLFVPLSLGNCMGIPMLTVR